MDLKVKERAYYEAFNARELDRYAELFTQDVEVIASGGIRMHGVDAMREFDRSWHTAFPDNVITLTSQTQDGSTVVSENVFTGTHTGVLSTPAGDIPPTGSNVVGEYVAVLRFAADGKISSFRAYLDRMELLEALGIVPAPAGS